MSDFMLMIMLKSAVMLTTSTYLTVQHKNTHDSVSTYVT